MNGTGWRRALGIMISEPRGVEAREVSGNPAKLPEDGFIRKLCRFGAQLGLLVYAFRPSSVSAQEETVQGYVPQPKGWSAARLPMPDFVYDRMLCTGAAERRLRSEALASLRQRHSFVLLNGTLPGKLGVYEALAEAEQLRPLLPPTFRYEGKAHLAELAKRFSHKLFLKPAGGCQGRGVIRLERSAEGWRVDGRSGNNVPFSRSFTGWTPCAEWIDRFVRSVPYIVQPCLQLNDEDGNAFDVRCLIQKNERGLWRITGIALRAGAPGSITANLHGGGTATEAEPPLIASFGAAMTERLLTRIKQASKQAAAILEERFGRLCELGIDFGIEPGGKLWLIEANAKPGRESFRSNPKSARLAVSRPLRYASLLPVSHHATAPPAVFSSVTARDPSFSSLQPTRNQRRSIQEVHP